MIPKDPAFRSAGEGELQSPKLLAPARGAGFLACGRVLRPGRTLTVCQADVFTTEDAERALIATMLSTIIVRPRSSGDEPGEAKHPPLS